MKPKRNSRAGGLSFLLLPVIFILFSSCGLETYSSYIYPIETIDIKPLETPSFRHVLKDFQGYENIFQGYQIYYRITKDRDSESEAGLINPRQPSTTEQRGFYFLYQQDAFYDDFFIINREIMNPLQDTIVSFNYLSRDTITVEIGDDLSIPLYRLIPDPVISGNYTYKSFSSYSIGETEKDIDIPSGITSDTDFLYLSFFAVPFGFDLSTFTSIYGTPSFIGHRLLSSSDLIFE